MVSYNSGNTPALDVSKNGFTIKKRHFNLETISMKYYIIGQRILLRKHINMFLFTNLIELLTQTASLAFFTIDNISLSSFVLFFWMTHLTLLNTCSKSVAWKQNPLHQVWVCMCVCVGITWGQQPRRSRSSQLIIISLISPVHTHLTFVTKIPRDRQTNTVN